jgi:hypothetical protein
MRLDYARVIARQGSRRGDGSAQDDTSVEVELSHGQSLHGQGRLVDGKRLRAVVSERYGGQTGGLR